jgi:outer membrane protein assembly factor BamD
LTHARIKRSFQLILLISAVATLQFCASQKNALESKDIAETYRQAMEFYEKENYLRAEETFTFILYNDPGGEFADDAQFYLAETYFAKEEFLLAISEYDRLIRRMKNSPYVEAAFWKKTESYCELSPDFRLEREMTDKALRNLYDFLEIYPESKYRDKANARIIEMREKLAMKLLASAKLYSTLREYESSLYYYDSIITDYPDTQANVMARLGKADAMVNLERWDEARQLLNSIAIEGRETLSQKDLLKFKAMGNKVIEQTTSQGS